MHGNPAVLTNLPPRPLLPLCLTSFLRDWFFFCSICTLSRLLPNSRDVACGMRSSIHSFSSSTSRRNCCTFLTFSSAARRICSGISTLAKRSSTMVLRRTMSSSFSGLISRTRLACVSSSATCCCLIIIWLSNI